MSKLSGILFKSLSARVMSSFAKRQWLICFFFTVVSVQFTHSQLFPVQVSPQLTPPYSLKLSDYSTSTTEKLLVNLLLTDVNEADLQVRLRFSISGNSVNIQSKDFVQNAAPIQLTGGIPLRLSNLDLQPYFDLQNLDGITPSEYSKPLPDGLYQFCFEVFDWTTGRPLSEKKCYPVYLVLNDPPFLNLPQNGEQVPAQDPQNLIFQWTPRHVNATGVEYEFELRELWDTNVDPQTAFLASPNLYQTKGFANTLLYGPGETSLLEGKTYGWRVRAVVSDGISETAVFKNAGYSEIFYFTYTGKCDAPQYILAKSEGTTTEEITWQQNPDHINYQIQFRKEGGSNNVWFESETVETKKKLFFLEAETTYEYRVGGQCVQNGGYSYSAINTFTTPGKEDASEYNCGIPPEIVITNQDPLQQLGVNDVFTAGDFPVTVKEVNGGNGNYTGWGFIVVPYLGDTQIRVTFNNIQINTDKQLTNGIVETEYDEKFATTGGAGMSDVSELTELIEGDNDIDELNVNFVIPPDYFEDYITVEDGQVVIRNPNDAQVRTSPLGDDKVIVDSAGNTYHVDAEGNVTKGGKIDEGGPVNADNVEGVTKNGNIESLTAKGITVTFNTRGTYGYDKLPTGINNTKLSEEYKSIKDAKGANYEIVNHVAEKNKSSLITATVSISNSDYTIDDLIFKTKQGELLTHTKATNNTINLSVQGRYTFENEPIYAVVKSKQDTTKQQTAGAFNLWHLSRKTVDVVLVSVDGAQLPTAIELNTIFNQAATTLNIETKSVSLTNGLLGADNKLEIGDKPWLNTYNQEQKAIIADLKQKIDYQKDKYYVFTFNSGFNTTKSIAGFMPLKRQFGFVFNGGLSSDEEGKGDLAKVTAHEVAHGIFALQHPFTTYGNDIKGKTPWLMDYANDDLLSHMDWAQIHNPNLKFYIFQDEEDGEHVGEGFANYICINTNFKKELIESGYHFLDMNGNPIILDSDNIPSAFLASNEGVYYGKVGAINHNNHNYLYGLYKKDGKPIFSGAYLRNSLDKIYPKKGDISKAVLVQINEDGNYKIVKNDGSILKSGKTEVIKCSFVNNKDTSVNESLIAQGLSEDKIIIELSEGINQTDSRYDDIIKLSKYVKSIIKESKWSFLYKQTSGKNKYPKNYGRDLLIMVLKEKKIFTIADFDDNFRYFKYEKDDPYYIQDIDVLISNFDPWEGIPEEYNRHTFDYTSFNVPDLNNKEIIVSQINIIEDLFTSISKNYPNYFTEKQKLKFIDYIDNRRSTEGINSILNHRLSERKNMIAAYQALGAFDKYHYSIKDFKVREFLESTGNFIGEIKKNEASGVATPIHISESYDQYVAKHNSNSAFFYGVEYLKMYGDLLEFEVLGNAVVKAQKALSKNFKKFNIPTNNADLTISTTAVKNKMSGFNKIASESSQTVKSNIRTLRKWAKSKGYTKKAGSGSNSDTPEVWGTSNNGKFTEKLKLDGSSGEIKITATTIEGKPLKVKLSDGSEVNATAMPLTSKIDNFVYLTNNIPLSLSNKLGKKVTELENWLLKYSNDIGEDATKLLTNLKDNIGNKQILEVLEDGQKRLTVVTKGDGITNDVISLQKNVNGRYTNVTYNRAYNPTANMEIDVALSKNKLTPDYTKTQLGSISTKYLYPKNLLPSGKLPVVKIKMSGKRKGTGGDFDLANQAIGMKAEWGIEAPRGYVWHHMDDFNPNTGECTMQLVKSNAHTRVKGMAHSGSVAQYKAYYINTENTSNGLFYNN